MTSDKVLVANGFCEFFTNVSKSLQNGIQRIGNSVWKYHDHSHIEPKMNKEVTPSIILKKIKSLNSSKACGYDNIPISFIKDAAEEIAPIVSHMINRCIEQSVFPTAEKIAKVTPIYKGDSHKPLENYRPISVLNSLSKIFELVIHEQLYEFLETNGMLGQSQFGFRKNRSTQHAVTLLTDQI